MDEFRDPVDAALEDGDDYRDQAEADGWESVWEQQKDAGHGDDTLQQHREQQDFQAGGRWWR